MWIVYNIRTDLHDFYFMYAFKTVRYSLYKLINPYEGVCMLMRSDV